MANQPISSLQYTIDHYLKLQSNAPPLYSPTNYWKPYVKRLIASLDQFDVNTFRSSYHLTKGYSSSDIFQWDPYGLPKSSPKYWLANSFFPALPLIGKLFRYYNSRLKFHSEQSYNYHLLYAKLILSLAYDLNVSVPPDTLVGHPPTLSINSKSYSLSFIYSLNYFLKLKDFFKSKLPKNVVEIGAGFGSFCEIFCKINPDATYVIYDIFPLSIISYSYLSKVFPGQVGNLYDFTNKKKKQIYVLPVSELPNTIRSFNPSLLINQASFQEMEVENIINYISLCDSNYMFISSLTNGHKAGSNNQKNIIDFSTLLTICNGLNYKPVSLTNKMLDIATSSCDLSIYSMSVFERS